MTKRRGFIKKSLAGAAGLAVGLSARSYASVMGANDRINLAVIGIRNQGSVHIDAFCKLKESHNVRIRTLCDVDEQLFPSRLRMVKEKSGEQPATEWNMQKVFADKDIDAVSIVTPNHWHALATIWALQAGKHVYIEKPAMHSVWEGNKMVEAARKYNKRVQVGLNNRSLAGVREAIQFLHEGGIGDVYMARGICYKSRDSYGIAKDSTPPANFHYDQWLGPAPYRPYNEKRSHYNFHWYWDTGNGDIGNTGPHQFDIARWGLNKNEYPVSVYSNGGLYGFNEHASNTPGVMVYGDVEQYGHDKTSQETPNAQSAVLKYADGKMIGFEVRSRYTYRESSLGIEVGNTFFGSEGYLELNGGTWKAFRRREKEPFATSTEKPQDGTQHWANFLDAIRSGNNKTLRGDIVDGVLSSALPLLSNISYRLDRNLKIKETGTALKKFVDDEEADAMLRGSHRAPYTVPENV